MESGIAKSCMPPQPRAQVPAAGAANEEDERNRGGTCRNGRTMSAVNSWSEERTTQTENRPGDNLPSVDKALRHCWHWRCGRRVWPLKRVRPVARAEQVKPACHARPGASEFRRAVASTQDLSMARVGAALETYLIRRHPCNPGRRCSAGEQINEVCYISVLAARVLYIERIESKQANPTRTKVGMRLPALDHRHGSCNDRAWFPHTMFSDRSKVRCSPTRMRQGT